MDFQTLPSILKDFSAKSKVMIGYFISVDELLKYASVFLSFYLAVIMYVKMTIFNFKSNQIDQKWDTSKRKW